MPLVKEFIYLRVLQLDVGGNSLVHSGVGGEGLSEVHDQVIKEYECGLLRVVLVCDGCGTNVILGRVAVAHTDVILKGHTRLVARGDAAGNGARIEVDMLLSHIFLVEPEHGQVHVTGEAEAVVFLPLEDVKGY